jgi:hypothetical protein
MAGFVAVHRVHRVLCIEEIRFFFFKISVIRAHCLSAVVPDTCQVVNVNSFSNRNFVGPTQVILYKLWAYSDGFYLLTLNFGKQILASVPA